LAPKNSLQQILSARRHRDQRRKTRGRYADPGRHSLTPPAIFRAFNNATQWMARQQSDAIVAAGEGWMMSGDTRFWTFFGGVWLLVGVMWVIASLVALVFVDPAALDEPFLVWVFLALGLIASIAGGVIILWARTVAARDRRLASAGIQLTGTVTGLRRSPVNVGRHGARWHIVYRYEYTAGRPLIGESRGLPTEETEQFKLGDRVLIKVDPERHEASILLGRA